MALTANFVRSSISADGLTSNWTDSTVYGGANPNRVQVAIWLTAYKVDVNQVETGLTVTVFDPELATSFVTTNGIDGWTRYYFIIINNWLVGTTYNRYDLVWDATGNKFYQYINVTSTAGNAVSNATYWAVVADPTIYLKQIGTSTAVNNIAAYQIINKVLDYQTSICYIKAASKHAEECCGNDDCGCDSRLGKLYHKIRDIFSNLTLNESTGQFLSGEKNARLVEKYCSDCGCLND